MSVEDPRLSNISEENLTENFSSEIQEEIAASSTPSPIEHEIQVAQAGDGRTPTTGRVPTDPNVPAAAPAAPAAEVTPDVNNIVHLATSVSIDDIRVDGANLILVQADGTEIVIVNGAAKIPTMLIGEVEVPQQVLFAALEDSGINVAAGPDGSFSASGRPDSSGAEFDDSIQASQNDPIQLASLLGDTEFGDGGGLDDRTAADDQPDAFDMGSPFIFAESVLADDVIGNETITGTLGFDGGDDFGIVSSVNYQSTFDMAEGTGSGVAAPLTSGGQAVTVSTSADGLTVTGTITVGETTVTVFTLTVTNPTTGAFTYTQSQPLDHPDLGEIGADDALRLNFTFTVTDKDGDSDTGSFSIEIGDDGPKANVVAASAVLDDEAQGNGNSGTSWLGDVNPNVASVSGPAGALFTAGADGVKSIAVQGPAFNVIYTDGDGFAHKEAIAWGPTGVVGPDGSTTFTATGSVSDQTAAVLTINADGSYTLTLEAPVAHDVALPAVEENRTLSFDFTVTDGDGDQAGGKLNVRVNDDTPTPVASVVLASQAMDDEAQSLFTPVNTGGAGDVTVDTDTVSGGPGSLFKIGADGLGSLSVGLPGFSVVYEDGGFAKTESVSWSEGVRSANGTTTYTATGVASHDTAAVLVIRADGSYSFTLEAPVAHSSSSTTEDNKTLNFTYGVTDGDGDQAGGVLSVSVDDDTPTANVVTSTTVLDDEAQGSGNNTPADGIANEHVATGLAGSLFTAGADGVKSVAINNPAFSVIYEEGGLAKTESVDWSAGVKGANGSTTFTATGHVSGQTAAVLVVNADGSYSFTAEAPVVHSTAGTAEENTTLSIGVTVTDGDGDTATGTLNINVNDDTPVSKGVVAASAVLDDEAQGNGNSGTSWLGDVNPNVASVSGPAGALFTAGADGVKSIAVQGPAFNVIYTDGDGFAHKEAIAWGPTGVVGPDGSTTFTATGSVSDQTAAVLTINADGSYTLTLEAPVAHDVALPAVEENRTLSFDFTVTDGDGDQAGGKLNVRVNDDTPTPVASVVLASQAMDDEAQSLFTPVNTGGAGDVTVDTDTVSGGPGSLFKIGADGLGSLSVGLPGFSVVYEDGGFAKTESVSWSEGVRSANGTTTYTATGVASHDTAAVLVIRADGSYSFTLEAPVAHSSSSTTEDNKTLNFTYGVTDGDGDQAGGVLSVSVDDDTPTANVVTSTTVLDDEAQGSGNNTPADGIANEHVATGLAGSLFTAGADGVKSVAINNPAFSVIYEEGGLAKTESVDWSAGVKGANGSTTFTATGHVSGQTAAVLVVNADGSYSFTAEAPVVHSTAGTAEENTTLSIGVTVTDGDGDTATGTLNINVNDDTPISTGAIGIGITESAAGGSIAGELSGLVSPGADGLGRYSVETAGLSSSLTSLTSGGVALTYSVVGNALVAKAGDVSIFTFAVDPATGHYTFTQTGPLDHSDNVVIDDVSIPAAALDTAGSHAEVPDVGHNDLAFVGRMPDGDVIIRVSNDGDSAVSWTLHNDAGGADSVLQIPAHTTWYVNVGNVGNQTKFDLDGVGSPNGSTTVNNGHPITFTDGDGSLALDLSSAVTVTDGDGDSVALNGQLIVTVTDGVPTAGPNASGTVEEGGTETITAALTGLAWGADAGSARTLSFTGNVATTDQNGASVAGLSSSGRPVTIDVINGVLTGFVGSANPPAPGDIVFTASLNVATGAYSFSLLQPLDHTAPNATSQYLDLALSFTATDADGDAATSTVTVRVDAAGTIGSINYSNLSTSVFVNLDDAAHMIGGQTVAADTATDTDGVAVIDKVIGIDSVSGIVDALGGSGNDVLIGGDEANNLNGNGGDDSLFGGAGNDRFSGGTGINKMVGGTGNDQFFATGGTDTIHGNGEADIAATAGENDMVVYYGNQSNFAITRMLDGGWQVLNTANGEIDKLYGVESINFNGGAIELDLTAPVQLFNGNNLVGTFTTISDANTAASAGFRIELVGTVTNQSATITKQNLTVVGGAEDIGIVLTLDGVQNITLQGEAPIKVIGDGLSNTINGNDGANILEGGDGNDVLNGNGGDDSLFGGAGNDRFSGGTGINKMVGGTGNDQFFATGGTDTIHGNGEADIAATAGENDMVVYYGNQSNFAITRMLDGGWQVLNTANGEIDKLYGVESINFNGGAIELDLTAPVQLFNGNNLVGTFTTISDANTAASAGFRIELVGTVTNQSATITKQNLTVVGGAEDIGIVLTLDGVQNITLQGEAPIKVIGDGLSNTINGNDGANILEGGDGNDILNGNGGDDTIQWSVGDGLDVVDGGTELAGGRDLLRVVGSSASEQYAIWSVAAYNAAHAGAPYGGSAEILLTVNGALAAEVKEIEDIVIQGGGGTDTIAVIGSFAGTSLLTSTITYEGGEGDETFDVSELTSGHSVVVKGAGGTDVLVIGDEAGESIWKDVIVTRDPDSGEFTIELPNGGPVLKATGVESFQFFDGTVSAAQLIEQAPTDLTTSGLTVAENSAAGTIIGSVQGVDVNGSIDPLSYAFVLADSSTSLTSADGRFVINASTGEISVAAGAVLDYETTPSIDLSVRVTDSKNGSYSENVNVQLTNVNEAPVLAQPIADQSIAEEGTISFQVPGGTFSDVDSVLTYSATLGDGSALPTWLHFDAGTGTFSGTPDLNWNGAIGVKVTASDGSLSASDTFTLTVTPVNDAPIAVNDYFFTNEDTARSGMPLFANDSDIEGNPLTANGITVGGQLGGSISLEPNGTLYYKPRPNESGYAVLQYSVSDGNLTSTGTVTIDVRPIADTATISGSGLGNEDATAALSLTIALGDTDGSEKVTRVELSGFPLGATFNQGALEGDVWVITNTAGVNTTGLTMTPPANYAGNFNLSVSATVLDSATLSDLAVHTDTKVSTGSIGVSITPVNDGQATISVTDLTQTATDPTVGDVLRATLGSDPDGTATNVVHTWLRDGNDTGVTTADYTLTADDVGHQISVQTTYVDGQNFSETVTSGATAAVITNNHAPVAVDDIVLTNIIDGSAIVIRDNVLLANDTDADNNPLNISSADGALGGIVTHNTGSVTFTPTLVPIVATNIYSFSGVTQANNNALAYEFQLRTANFNDLDALNPSSNSDYVGSSSQEASNTDYNAIAADDSSYWNTDQPNFNRNQATWFQFNVTEDPSTLTQIAISVHTGRPDESASGDDLILGAWDYVNNKWVAIGSTDADNNTIGTISATLTANLANYVNGGHISLVLFNEDTNDAVFNVDGPILVDNVQVSLTSAVAPSFTSGAFDYTATDGQASDSGHVTVKGVAGSTITGTTAAEIIIAGAGDDTIVGADNDKLLNGGDGTDTLRIGATFISASDGQIVGIEKIELAAPVSLNLSNQTEGFSVSMDAGNTANQSWNVTLASNSAKDEIIFNHDALGINNNTVATVSNFETGNDKIAITLGSGSSPVQISNGGFQEINVSTNDVLFNSNKEVIEIVVDHGSVLDLTKDSDGDAIEDVIANAIDDIPAGTYTVIVYSSTNTTTADAGIYTMLVSTTQSGNSGGNSNLTDNKFSIEHVMTLSGVGYGKLSGTNFSSVTDPIILDLDHNGFAFTYLEDGVKFDINADGKLDQVAWTKTDGILAYDVDGNGKIDNGSEIFTPNFAGGAHAGGMAALSTLDVNHDGKIDASDTGFDKLLVWQDANGNGVSDEGELKGLNDYGITGISLDAESAEGYLDGQALFAEGSFTYADGSTGSFVEVGFDTLFSDAPDHVLVGTDGDNILAAMPGLTQMTGGAGADTFVLDPSALHELDMADIITDYKSNEGDAVDVSKLLDTLLGHQATGEEAAANVRTTIAGNDTTVSVQVATDSWKDVAVLQNHTEAVKILFDDDKHSANISHV
ncbi:DUF5801 repeats-in-toxin domain-containing protein [Neorhizobium sp. T25_13]|uniref:T1SS-143 repeat domain-containing protein n=1 Tax=Neorhizobium sp. T25_13 TaxID=2093830 RepID=UPI000CF976BF|nr:tandem-95 repeat protein [Neorhizobium sp. T25_13]